MQDRQDCLVSKKSSIALDMFGKSKVLVFNMFGLEDVYPRSFSGLSHQVTDTTPRVVFYFSRGIHRSPPLHCIAFKAGLQFFFGISF